MKALVTYWGFTTNYAMSYEPLNNFLPSTENITTLFFNFCVCEKTCTAEQKPKPKPPSGMLCLITLFSIGVSINCCF